MSISKDYLKNVLEALSKVDLYLPLGKYRFNKEEVKYVRLIIRKEVVWIDIDNIVVIQP